MSVRNHLTRKLGKPLTRPWALLLCCCAIACTGESPTRAEGPSDWRLADLANADLKTTDLKTTDLGQPNQGQTIGVFYYPWYGGDFHGGEYLRSKLEPRQLPEGGEYDDRDPTVIARHIAWTREAGIGVWVASWWGPDSRTDQTLKDVIMKHGDLPGTRVALFYETKGRITPGKDINNAYTDIAYAAKTYFGDPNYLRIGGRPVIAVYVTRALSVDRLAEAVEKMRRAAKDNGHQIYIIGDQVFGHPPGDSPYRPFEILDAVTNYDVYGEMGRPRYAEKQGVDQRRERQAAWRRDAHRQGCAFVPSVAPGYNDRGVRLESNHPGLSRRLSASAPQGSLFQATLKNAMDLVDESTGKLLLINSWNEWHEDTQIEPVGSGTLAAKPQELTQGLDYHVYGTLYLDIVKAAVNGQEVTLPR